MVGGRRQQLTWWTRRWQRSARRLVCCVVQQRGVGGAGGNWAGGEATTPLATMCSKQLQGACGPGAWWWQPQWHTQTPAHGYNPVMMIGCDQDPAAGFMAACLDGGPGTTGAVTQRQVSPMRTRTCSSRGGGRYSTGMAHHKQQVTSR